MTNGNMTEFPTRRVNRSAAKMVEPLGSKPKFWFREGERRLLFKAETRGTGEDWAEVVSCHLCELLGLPHVRYELAVEYDGEKEIHPGVVCENMAPSPLALALGNDLLLSLDPDYPATQQFKVRQHTVGAVREALTKLNPPSANWRAGDLTDVRSALDVFVGYVMLDAWIANPDRHHENWGALVSPSDRCLAPTFDHGAALARNLLDSERHDRLTTKDRGRTVAAFVQRGRSAFYGSSDAKKPLLLSEAFSAFACLAPAAAEAWLNRLRTIEAEEVWSILEKVPDARMTDTCRLFAKELLRINRQRLLEQEIP